jgi:molybdenum cofactor cytidylyltransferase
VIFGTFPLAEATGCILAHAHRLPGRILRKGTSLDEAAIAALREAGTTGVVAACLEAGDIGENEAATRLARVCTGPGLTARAAHTGRVNIHAERPGLLELDRAALDHLNSLDEALTIATLPDATKVANGSMVATVKIIPLAVPGALLERAETLASPLALAPFGKLTAGLVVTVLPGLKDSVIDGTIAATAGRMESLGGTLLPPLRAPHAEAPLAAALAQLRSAGAELLLVAVASATVDRRDVGPAAIERAGGRIHHFGMPVDPGNLMCIGEWDGIPAVVLPGCARSPRANGIDLVLRRYAAGLPVGKREIMAMGAGGLLADTEARPLPRTRAVAAEPAAEPRCAAVVLAAGASTRMAPHHKLLIEDRTGRPMIERTVANVLASGARPVIVVTGAREAEIRAALSGKPVTFVHAADHADGLSASLRAGIRALPPNTRAALVVLGDMPLVPGRVLDQLIAAHVPVEGRSIIVPTYKGRAGNPVLWDAALFPEILALTGDEGARKLLACHAEQVAELDVAEEGILRDFDTVESLATLPARQRPDWVTPR